MKKYSTLPLVVMTLGAIAATLPIFGGYFVSFVLLLWLGRQRFFWRKCTASRDEFLRLCFAVFRPLITGAVALVVLLLLANLVANGLAEEPARWSRVLGKMSHFGVKYLLLGYVVIAAWLVWARRGLRPEQLGPWVLVWFGLHTVYLIAQRQWGMDWTHGFDAVLGPHRFAYGVFRISGFMGHPLTLAYVLCLWFFAAWSLGQGAAINQERMATKSWVVIAGLSGFSLLISGSRFPLVVVAVVMAVVYGRHLIRHVKVLTLVMICAALLLWWEGSLVGRMLEVFHTNQDLSQRFPRVFFWQAHFAMFLDYPIAGIGLLHLEEALPTYYHQIGYHDKIYSAHNIYLQFLADSGLIGFLGLSCFLTGFGLAAHRLKTLTGSTALWSLWLITVLAGTMQNVLRDSEYIYALWILSTLVVIQAARRQALTNETQETS